MMRSLAALFLTLVVFTSCQEKKTDSQNEAANWESLFNGKNLDGWTIKIAGYELGENFGKTFRVEDSILSIRYDQYGDNFNSRFGALYFNKKFSNYRLKVEYRFVGETAPGAPEWGFRDSGVQYHGQSPSSVKINQLFPVCLEYNLHGGNGKDERPVGEICANGIFIELNGKKNKSYCTPPTVTRTFHGDQWVRLEIDVKGSSITHFVNGEAILSYESPEYDTGNEIAKTLIINGDASVKEGFISLQSNSHPIDFRKIEILEY